jgi:hypothetical protein
VIFISVGNKVVLKCNESSAREIVALQVAMIRRFQRGMGFPVTFLGFDEDVTGEPSRHITLWLHPSMSVEFDYGTDCPQVEVDDVLVDKHMHAMDTTE